MGLELENTIYQLTCRIEKLESRLAALETTPAKPTAVPPKEKKPTPLKKRVAKFLDTAKHDLLAARNFAVIAGDTEAAIAINDLMDDVS